MGTSSKNGNFFLVRSEVREFDVQMEQQQQHRQTAPENPTTGNGHDLWRSFHLSAHTGQHVQQGAARHRPLPSASNSRVALF